MERIEMFKINDIKSAICSRKSCRNFQHRRIDVTIKEQLSFLLSNKLKGICRTEISFELIERPLDNSKEMKLTYGLLRGHNAYILAKIKPSKTALIDYGYLLEGIALKVQELGLASCWVGYFDQDYFPEIKLTDSEMIPSILVVGYPNDSFFLGSKIAEIVSGRAKRKEWKELVLTILRF
jgi:nitroreductase